jgi:hypothetical protein
MSQGTHYLHVFVLFCFFSSRPSVRFSLMTPTIRYWPDGHSLNKFTQSTRGYPAHTEHTPRVYRRRSIVIKLLAPPHRKKHKDIYQRHRLNFLFVCSCCTGLCGPLQQQHSHFFCLYFCLYKLRRAVADHTK